MTASKTTPASSAAAPLAIVPAPALSPPLIPGLEVVGRGIYLRPYQPYGLSQLLFKRDKYYVVPSKETGTSYSVPEGYEVNESPPFPVNESLNQVSIEESWDRFEKQNTVDVNVSTSNMPFTVNASTSWNNRLRSEQEAYYATRSSFVPLWTVYVPNLNSCIEAVRDPDIPVPFSHDHRRHYEEFFRAYGSHFVSRAWVGGKSTLVFTVLKSARLAKEDIQAGLKASFAGVGGGASTTNEENRERLKRSSQCTVFGKGGNEVQLAAMSSLDEDAYNAWLKTIPSNPQVIELDVAGIWTLVRDPLKAATLMEAYKEAVSFTPLTAAFSDQDLVYFIRGDNFITYNRQAHLAQPPMAIASAMPPLAALGFATIDAAFRGTNLTSPTGEKLDRKVFLFRQNRFVRFDLDKQQIDDGYPMLITEGWPGTPFERVDAAMATERDTIYLFFGKQYARFNSRTGRMDEGYPQPISKRWVGVTFDRIDAAVYWGNGKAYFFKGDQHIRYDLANYRADSGYPKYIIGNYVHDWKFIDG